MSEGTPAPTSSVYSATRRYDDADGTRFTGPRSRTECRRRAEAIKHFIPDGETVIYAFQLADGTIKIGCTGNILARRNCYKGSEILAFRVGDEADEQAIHDMLVPHRARGWEYYHPTPEVLAVVNDMRDDFGLPHLAA